MFIMSLAKESLLLPSEGRDSWADSAGILHIKTYNISKTKNERNAKNIEEREGRARNKSTSREYPYSYEYGTHQQQRAEALSRHEQHQSRNQNTKQRKRRVGSTGIGSNSTLSE